jgi:hypothetical protein
MNSINEFKAIADLDLEPIKVKLMHEESGENWSLEYVNAVEIEYRRFLYLMKKFPNEGAAPLFDVDIFWHYHILDTLKYAADCENVFGYFLHHFPYVGLRGADDEELHHQAGARMQELYESTFDEPYLRPLDGSASPESLLLDSSAASESAHARQGQTTVKKAAKSSPSGQEAAAAGRNTAFSYTPPTGAIAATRKAAFSYTPPPGAIAATRKTAFSYTPPTGAVVAARKTAFSYTPPPGVGVAMQPEIVASRGENRISLVAGNQEAGDLAELASVASRSNAIGDLATLRRPYFERPVLAAA